MKNFIAKIKNHKVITAAVALILIGGGYYWYNSSSSAIGQVRYITEAAAKQTIITSVSGSGQMSTSNQVDLKPKVSGDIIKIAVTASQTVKRGDVIAQIDATNAYKAVRDAQTSLESAQLALQKLKQPADQLSMTQAQNALESAKLTKQNAEEDLSKSYDDGFNNVANAFLDLPGIITGLNNILYNYSFNNNQQNVDYYYNNIKDNDPLILNYKNDAISAYNKARSEYDKNFNDYKAVDRYSGADAIEGLIEETYNTAKDMADAVKSINNYIQFYEDNLSKRGIVPSPVADSQLSTLNGYTGKTNSHLLNLLSIKQTIQNDKDTITGSDRTINEKTQSLAKLQAGTDPLDIKSQELTVKQRENTLSDSQNALADYTIRAPFDGIIAAVNFKVGDPASSATAIATIITSQQIAEISLNEVDAAKTSVGQKVTLTFDAIDGLELTGKVAQIDAIGTVAQGVVSYNVKIILDTQDQRIKAGMSVNTTIITGVKTDVLAVLNSAVKTDSSGLSYVQILGANGQPQNQTVQIGIANDTVTEIVSGLSEGEKVVAQTINSAAKTSTTQSSGGFGGIRIPGVGGGGR